MKTPVPPVSPYAQPVSVSSTAEYGSLACSGPGCIIQNTFINHQAILYENGDIEFHYGPRNAPSSQNGCATPHLGCSATVGLRNSDGLDNDEFGCNGATLIDNGTVIYFVHPN